MCELRESILDVELKEPSLERIRDVKSLRQALSQHKQQVLKR
ncbi:hypothetical protein [Pseudoalteromonas lipolytica]|nr:hypothetical protein [Pseudoalteromonas lipolytica]MBE0352680.1 hypothetical protein [Pseudoalteromonas lipolytica LMEB 39]